MLSNNSLPLIGRLSLFWRLFLSLLLMLVLTSIISMIVENWLATKRLKNSMQRQVDSLIIARQQIATALENNDRKAVTWVYQQDKRLIRQITVVDEFGDIVFPRHHFRGQKHVKKLKHSLKKQFKNNRQFDQLLQQMNVSEIDYPQLADTTITAIDGSIYVIKIQPRLPLPEIIALRQDYKTIRLGLIVLFSLLVCYGFSYTLTRRIRRLQQAVHKISEGNYQNDNNLIATADDELGKLTQDIARLSNRLKDSELARKQMLSDISHELRSPLARLDVATEISRDFAPQASKYLDRIEKESHRMNELIGHIIHIQSLQMQGYTINTDECTQVNMRQLLADIKQDVCFEFHSKSVTWQSTESDLVNDSMTIFGNQEQLYSAIENIIRNAFIHTHDHTSVTVSVQATTLNNNQAVQIDVMDMGDGIDNTADLQRIFQPFVRLSKSRERVHSNTQKSTGYGLGLAIAHAIITAHKGQLTAYNRTDNHKGLVVSIMLPIDFSD